MFNLRIGGCWFVWNIVFINFNFRDLVIGVVNLMICGINGWFMINVIKKVGFIYFLLIIVNILINF